MMIAIISDVHGNYPALKAVLKDIDSIGCERIISLGDVAGYYCMVNECIDEFRKRRIVNLMGNHDYYLLGFGKCPRSTTVNQCIEYQKRIISAENLEYLKLSPLFFDNDCFSARHGGWKDPIDEYIDDFDFSKVEGLGVSIYCSGHTHIQKIIEANGKIYFNPGSVGQPRDGNPNAAYALIDDDKVYLRRVAYNVDEIFYKMQEEGFDRRISDCLYHGEKVRTYKL